MLVTGAAGFIGSHLTERLVREGCEVIAVDNLSTGYRANLEAILPELKFVEGDAGDYDLMCRLCTQVEVVFHEAALASVPLSVRDPLSVHAADATATLQVLRAAVQSGVRRLVYAGSAAAYGDSPTLPKHEDLVPVPLSPYAAAKLAGEHYCRAFESSYGLETIALRYFNVFGPRQDPRSPYAAAVPIFVTAALAGEAPRVFGDGRQTRDFTYVDNVVEANLLALRAPVGCGGVYNVAAGVETDLNKLLATLAAIVGHEIVPVYAPPQPGDIARSVADISQARRVLGYEPRVSLREGLERTVAWARRT